MMRLVEPVVYMQLQGANVDQQAKAKHARILEQRYNAIVGALPINPSSSKKCAEYLYGDLKLPIKYKRGSYKKITTDDAALTDLFHKYKVPQLKAILMARHFRKILSTYVKAKLWKGRLHASFNITGAETGRFSSSSGAFGGTNLQNWPNPKGIETKIYQMYIEVRDIIIADEGMVLVSADLRQSDAMGVAWLSGDPQLIKFFKDGADVHAEVAKIINASRHTTKRIVHGKNYMMGFQTLAKHAGCSYEEAKRYAKRIDEKFPAIPRWQQETISKVKATRKLITPLGRERTFYGRFGPALWREAVAHVPQSITADVINTGLANLYEAGFDVLAQVHDEVLLQIPQQEDFKPKLLEITKLCTIPMMINGRELVIPVDIKVGSNWRELKEVKL